MLTKLFYGFSEEEYSEIEKILKPRVESYKKGETICYEGQELKWIGAILKGKVIGSKYYEDGKTHLVHAFGLKDILGLEVIFSTKKESPITFLAAEDVEILVYSSYNFIEGGELKDLARSKIKDNIIRALADQNIKSIYKMEVLTQRSLRVRVMTFLNIMEQKLNLKTFHIGMDREQFAQYLCVNRSALSYELGQMKKEGLIDYKKDIFTIK